MTHTDLFRRNVTGRCACGLLVDAPHFPFDDQAGIRHWPTECRNPDGTPAAAMPTVDELVAQMEAEADIAAERGAQ